MTTTPEQKIDFEYARHCVTFLEGNQTPKAQIARGALRELYSLSYLAMELHGPHPDGARKTLMLRAISDSFINTDPVSVIITPIEDPLQRVEVYDRLEKETSELSEFEQSFDPQSIEEKALECLRVEELRTVAALRISQHPETNVQIAQLIVPEVFMRIDPSVRGSHLAMHFLRKVPLEPVEEALVIPRP